MARPNSPNLYHDLEIPTSLNENNADAVPNPFSPEELLGGFLIGPENGLAELAYRLAADGVPIFDRPIGLSSLDPVEAAVQEHSRADVEILLHAAQDGLLGSVLDQPNGAKISASILFDMATFNASRRPPETPSILGYRGNLPDSSNKRTAKDGILPFSVRLFDVGNQRDSTQSNASFPPTCRASARVGY